MPAFRIDVIINPAGATRGARTTRRQLQSIDKSAQKTQRLLSAVVLAAGIVAGVRILANFSQAMSTVEAITGATAEQMVRLTEVARDLGATTRFSSTQAAEGMLFLARAGFEVDEVLQSVGDTLLLAQAGALDLGTAADIASNVLTAFRLRTSEAGRVVDVLAVAANSANTNVQQLGDGLKLVAPIAAGVGVSLEETTAIIGALSDAGLQATLAGTGLRRIISELESPSTATRKVLKKLGLTTADVRISQKGLIETMKLLAEAGVDTGLALELFGDRGGPAFEVISSSLPKIDELIIGLKNSGGEALRISRIMDDNLNGALLAVRSALEAVILSLGELGITRILTAAIRGTATALRFMADNAEILIGVLTTLSIRAIPAAITGLIRLGIAAAAALGPVTLIVVGIGAVAGALVAFSDDITVTTDGMVTLTDVAKATFEFLRDIIGNAIIAIRESFNSLLQLLNDRFGPIFGQVLATIGSVIPSLQDVLGFLRQFINRFIGTFVGLSRALGVIFDALFEAIGDAFSSLFGINIVDFISSVVDFGKRALNAISSFALRILRNVGLAGAEVAKAIGETFDLPDLTIPPSVLKFGAEVSDAFLSGFNQDFIGGLEAIIDPAFDRITARAREIASLRIAAADAPIVTDDGQPPVKDLVTPGRTADGAFEAILSNLDTERNLLNLSNQEREIAIGLLQIEEELARMLSQTERELAEARLLDIQALTTQSNLLDRIVGPIIALEREQIALNELFEKGKISLDQYNLALMDLEFAALAADRSFGGGLRRAFLQITEVATDTAGQIESVMLSAFDKATDALAEFATKGSASFRDLASSILADLARIASQRFLFELLQSVFPGAELAGFQQGGSFQIGGSGGPDSQLVAFKASPMENVTITRPGQDAATQAPPIVNVAAPAVVIVDSEEKAIAAIQSAEGEDAVLAVLRDNPQAVQSITGA